MLRLKEKDMKTRIAIFAAVALAMANGAVQAQENQDPRAGIRKRAAHAAKAAPREALKQNKEASKPVLRKVTAEEIGKEAVCPTTGEKHTVKANTGSASYKGKIYHFCCPGCDKSFLADPEKYIARQQAPAAKAYACPMGDYQGDKPGKCPKCGMNLEEKK